MNWRGHWPRLEVDLSLGGQGQEVKHTQPLQVGEDMVSEKDEDRNL